jgi:hypothetical protein
MASAKRPSGSAPDSAPGGVPPENDAEKPADAAASSGSRRPKRVAPTIDLKATEVPADPPPPTANPESLRASSRPESKPKEDFTNTAPGSDSRGMPRFEVRDAISASTIAAGLTGGLLVSIVLFVLWLTGMVPIRYAGSTAMRARVSVLEMQLHDLSNRAPPDAKSSEELTQRVAKLEQALTQAQAQTQASGADPKLVERLDAAENAMKSLGVALAAINGRVDANAARVEATEKATADTTRAAATSDGALGTRVETLEKSAAAAESQIAKASDKANAAERSARFAVTASALRDAAVAGEPFAGELAAVKSLGADAAAVAALEPFATAGIPRDAVLARDLSAVLPQVMKLSGIDASSSGGFLDKLQANASKLVRVRPAGEIAGADTASVAARLERKAAQADIAGALAELKTLPAPVRAPAEGWIKQVEARNAAIDASRKLVSDSFHTLQ